MGSRSAAAVNSLYVFPPVRRLSVWPHSMRNATILIVRLRGSATEAIKNIVLAGIGKLVIVDTDDVSQEDLGAGFFFRDDDVGKKVP